MIKLLLKSCVLIFSSVKCYQIIMVQKDWKMSIKFNSKVIIGNLGGRSLKGYSEISPVNIWKDSPNTVRCSWYHICKRGKNECRQTRFRACCQEAVRWKVKGSAENLSEGWGGDRCGKSFKRMKEVWRAIIDNKKEWQLRSEILLPTCGLSIKITAWYTTRKLENSKIHRSHQCVGWHFAWVSLWIN